MIAFVFLLFFVSLCSAAGLNEIVMETSSSPGPFRNTQMSKAAQTHRLRKLRAPSKCRECDGLVVFHGAECEEVTAVYFYAVAQLMEQIHSSRDSCLDLYQNHRAQSIQFRTSVR